MNETIFSHDEAISLDEILSLIEEDHLQVARLCALFAGMNAVDIAAIFRNIGKNRLVRIFRLLPKSMAAGVFSYMEPEEQQIIVEALSENEVSDIINKLFIDDAVDVIEEMPADVVNRVLQNVHPEKRKLINQILQYPEDSAGSIMTTEYVELSAENMSTLPRIQRVPLTLSSGLRRPGHESGRYFHSKPAAAYPC